MALIPDEYFALLVWLARLLLPGLLFWISFGPKIRLPWPSWNRRSRQELLAARGAAVRRDGEKPQCLSTLMLVTKESAPALFQDRRATREERRRSHEHHRDRGDDAGPHEYRRDRDNKRRDRDNNTRQAQPVPDNLPPGLSEADIQKAQEREAAAAAAETRTQLESLVNFVALSQHKPRRYFLLEDGRPPPPPRMRPSTHVALSQDALLEPEQIAAAKNANTEAQMVLSGALRCSLAGPEVGSGLYAQLQDLGIEVWPATMELMAELCIEAGDLEGANNYLQKMDQIGHAPSNDLLDRVMELYLQHKHEKREVSTEEGHNGTQCALEASARKAPVAPPEATVSVASDASVPEKTPELPASHEAWTTSGAEFLAASRSVDLAVGNEVTNGDLGGASAWPATIKHDEYKVAPTMNAELCFPRWNAADIAFDPPVAAPAEMPAFSVPDEFAVLKQTPPPETMAEETLPELAIPSGGQANFLKPEKLEIVSPCAPPANPPSLCQALNLDAEDAYKGDEAWSSFEWSLGKMKGNWYRNGDPRLRWTIEPDGRSYFNGKYAGLSYDFLEEKVDGKVVAIYALAHRVAGEELNLHQSSRDQLIWTFNGMFSASWERAREETAPVLTSTLSADAPVFVPGGGAAATAADYTSSMLSSVDAYDMDFVKNAYWQAAGFVMEQAGKYQEALAQGGLSQADFYSGANSRATTTAEWLDSAEGS